MQDSLQDSCSPMLTFDDKDIPMKVQVKGWSPFIPNDADNSSLPVGAIEYILKTQVEKT